MHVKPLEAHVDQMSKLATELALRFVIAIVPSPPATTSSIASIVNLKLRSDLSVSLMRLYLHLSRIFDCILTRIT